MSALRPNQREKAAPSKSGAAAPLANGLIDPTKFGKYPVILSDTLLGKTQKDVFTGVRYNHKPTLSSESAPAHARLKPDTPGSQTNFELFFQDAGGKYGYEGSRTMDDNQYVLYFDPARKAFILDKVDSTFNLNLTRTPTNSNPETLRQQFQQLDASISVGLDTRRGTAETADKQPSKPAPKKTDGPMLKNNNAAKNRKQVEKKEAKVIELALPTPKPVKPKKQKFGSDDEEEEDDDDDFGLTIEYPGSEPNLKRADFSPAFPAQKPNRRFSEFLRDSEADDGDDADGEVDDELEDDRGLEGFKLPSPMNVNHEAKEVVHVEPEPMDVDSDADFEDALEDDLEAELEKELEQANSGDAEESEVSEED